MKSVNVEEYNKMMIYGAESLLKQVERINALNVFPVPDGDTGTNMNMTMQSGVKPLRDNSYKTIGEITKAVSKGMLLGARGNSGVILSQFFRGLAEGLSEKEVIEVADFKKALVLGKERAYNSVIKAVEGTILTVMNDLSKFEYSGNDFKAYFNELVKAGEVSLENTPNLLDVLKEVGVVDSGGAGLIEVFKGMQAALNGEELKIDNTTTFELFKQTEEHPLNVDDIIFGYCTEMLIKLNKEVALGEVREKLETFGDSIVAIIDDDILKTHVHTEKPTEVFAYGLTLGDFIHVKSENMRIQAEEQNDTKEAKENGIVIVAPSRKMAELFKEIQDVEVIVGGQTLNPSTEDIIKAIKSTNAENVIIFPNNSNIILACESAEKMLEDINVKIVKTKQMTQGLECLINYNTELTIDENFEVMNDTLNNIISYEVTNSIRDTKIKGVEVKTGDFLVIKDGNIVDSFKEELEALTYIKNDLDLDDIEIINVLMGENSKEDLIEQFSELIEEDNEFLEVQTYDTEQPVYSYLISAIKG